MKKSTFILLLILCLFYSGFQLIVTPDSYSSENDIENLKINAPLNSEDAITHYNSGLSNKYQGHLDEAIEEHQKAISLNPNYADPHYELGLSFQYRGLYDKAIYELSEFVRLSSPDDKKRLSVAQDTIEYAKYVKKSKEEQKDGVKLLSPILVCVFLLSALFLLGLAVKLKRLSFIFAAVHFIIVAPFSYYYVTSLGPSMGMEMIIPNIIDIPITIIWGVVANIVWSYTESQFTMFHRLFAVLCFPVGGTVLWFFIGYYWSKRKNSSIIKQGE